MSRDTPIARLVDKAEEDFRKTHKRQLIVDTDGVEAADSDYRLLNPHIAPVRALRRRIDEYCRRIAKEVPEQKMTAHDQTLQDTVEECDLDLTVRALKHWYARLSKALGQKGPAYVIPFRAYRRHWDHYNTQWEDDSFLLPSGKTREEHAALVEVVCERMDVPELVALGGEYLKGTLTAVLNESARAYYEAKYQAIMARLAPAPSTAAPEEERVLQGVLGDLQKELVTLDKPYRARQWAANRKRRTQSQRLSRRRQRRASRQERLAAQGERGSGDAGEGSSSRKTRTRSERFRFRDKRRKHRQKSLAEQRAEPADSSSSDEQDLQTLLAAEAKQLAAEEAAAAEAKRAAEERRLAEEQAAVALAAQAEHSEEEEATAPAKPLFEEETEEVAGEVVPDPAAPIDPTLQEAMHDIAAGRVAAYQTLRLSVALFKTSPLSLEGPLQQCQQAWEERPPAEEAACASLMTISRAQYDSLCQQTEALLRPAKEQADHASLFKEEQNRRTRLERIRADAAYQQTELAYERMAAKKVIRSFRHTAIAMGVLSGVSVASAVATASCVMIPTFTLAGGFSWQLLGSIIQSAPVMDAIVVAAVVVAIFCLCVSILFHRNYHKARQTKRGQALSALQRKQDPEIEALIADC